ncbi:MAG: alkaline phosphatase D family protein, partial [Thermocrispum sp.]
ERLDRKRTITGAAQEKWLIDGFNASTARWDVLGQQVFFARRDVAAGPDEGYSMDAWDGYVASQDKIASVMRDSRVRTGVVLTGDVHRHWAAEEKARYDGSDGDDVGVEFVTTSVTSGKDGDDGNQDRVIAENPHLKYYRNRRGYVRTTFTAGQVRADYRILPYVTKPGARAITDASFVVNDGDPTLHRAGTSARLADQRVRR